MSNGKGSKPRPVNREQYSANYDHIFRKQDAALGRIAGSVPCDAATGEGHRPRGIRTPEAGTSDSRTETSTGTSQ